MFDRKIRWISVSMAALVVIVPLLIRGSVVFSLIGYVIFPEAPRFQNGAEMRLSGLEQAVDVRQRSDGLYEIKAQSEHDLYLAEGYLQARDRMFQMDFWRHMGKGELAALIGDVSFGMKTTLDLDLFNRFVGFFREAKQMSLDLGAEERSNLEAFTQGVNLWIQTGPVALEHRLLEHEVEPWQLEDSLVIFRILMFGLTHNYTRELRRLVIACDAGLEAMENIWPSQIEFEPFILPKENLDPDTYPVSPSIVSEIKAELKNVCPTPTSRRHASIPMKDPDFFAWNQKTWINEVYLPLVFFSEGLSASNNWVVSGKKTKSGKPILANDPHLPHFNPPIVWGVHMRSPQMNVIGFTLAGVPFVVFGRNEDVAWGLTSNNVDLQDLYVEKAVSKTENGKTVEGYEYDGQFHPFQWRTEHFAIRGRRSKSFQARYSIHGLVLNDVDSFVKDRIPLTTLKTVSLENIQDGLAFRKLAMAQNVAQILEAIKLIDSASINWVFADREGQIGYATPCRVPIRHGWLGTFPVPGWLSQYEWQGYYPKEKLPASLNPEQGWIGTANNRVVPMNRFPSAYNTDELPPNRFLRISEFLSQNDRLTPEQMVHLQMDTKDPAWPQRKKALENVLCKSESTDAPELKAAKNILCAWNGYAVKDSVGATLYVLLTHAMMDRALPDELSGGVSGILWKYLQAIPHIETNIEWLWSRPEDAKVWDDVRTTQTETKSDIVKLALNDAIQWAQAHYGLDMDQWQWGKVRPFVLRHLFGFKDGLLGKLFNSQTFEGTGLPETVFKNQFLRGDRKKMDPQVGPVFRTVTSLTSMEDSYFSMAGGESGWPKSPYYGNLVADWMQGIPRRLVPPVSSGDVFVRFVPEGFVTK